MPAGIITSKSLPNNMRKEIDNIYRVTLAESPSEYDKVLKVEAAPMGPTFYETEITGMGLPTQLAEGEGVRYDTPVEGDGQIRSYSWFGMGYIITEQMIADELYGKMRKLPADLARSMRILTDIEGLRWYNEASTNSIVTKGEALCAAGGHPLLNDIGAIADGNYYKSGKLYNIPATPAALSETSLRQVGNYFDEMVDENGYPVMQELDKILVTKEDAQTAHRLKTQIYGSSLYNGGLGHIPETLGVSAPAAKAIAFDGQLSTANPSNGFMKTWDIVPSRFLNTGRWFALSADHDNKMYVKQAAKQTNETEFDTDNIKYKSKTRFGVWGNEHRGTFGNIIGNTQT